MQPSSPHVATDGQGSFKCYKNTFIFTISKAEESERIFEMFTDDDSQCALLPTPHSGARLIVKSKQLNKSNEIRKMSQQMARRNVMEIRHGNRPGIGGVNALRQPRQEC